RPSRHVCLEFQPLAPLTTPPPPLRTGPMPTRTGYQFLRARTALREDVSHRRPVLGEARRRGRPIEVEREPPRERRRLPSVGHELSALVDASDDGIAGRA